MNVIFVPEARDEFLDAIAYYEEARCGLGERFKEEADPWHSSRQRSGDGDGGRWGKIVA